MPTVGISAQEQHHDIQMQEPDYFNKHCIPNGNQVN